MKSKSKFVNQMRQSDAKTYNNAITNSTSLNSVLDLFFLAGACRNETEKNIIGAIARAIIEDKELTIKCILWAGDIRGGAGERRFFKIALRYLYENYNDIFLKVYKKVPFYSRWDVLFDYDEDYIYQFIWHNLVFEENGLLAKWLPRKKQYNNFASKFRKYSDINAKEYRKKIVRLSKIVETKLCKKEYDFDYSQVPSVAFKKYNKAFRRNDNDRFSNFLEDVKNKKTKINAGAIFPYDLYRSYKNCGDNDAIIQQWNCLPNYIDKNCSFMPVCDVSGSMEGLPMAISISLGCYLSERNKSVFKDAFITFSEQPTMQYLKGNIIERFNQLNRAKWDMNTNIQAVFDLILKKYIENEVSIDDMPTHILIISDMEFDSASEDNTNFEEIKLKFKKVGLEMPQLVFWNVNGRVDNIPVSFEENGVALVSGSSVHIIKNILSNALDPIKIMLETINIERYTI
jgi:hypothetical protein